MSPEERDEREEGGGSPADERAKNYWRLSLFLVFLFLAGGGYYSLTTMGDAAHKLAAGDKYQQLSANSAVYGGGGALQKNDNFFSPEELDPALPGSADGAGAGPGGTKNSPSGRLSDASGAAGEGFSSAARDEVDGHSAAAGEQLAPGAGTFTARLKARSSGPAGRSGALASSTSGGRETEAFAGGAQAAARPSAQRETNAAAARKSGGGGVIDALKGAFRASFYGARIASHDSARSWLARSFDASPEAATVIEYNEKMRAKLDRLNPDSIPKFLREQDVSAAEARTLAASEVGKPQADVEGTKEALKNDDGYQSKKLAKDMAAGAINPIGNLFSDGGNGAAGGRGATDERDIQAFVSPEDEPAYGQVQLDEYVSVNGYGAECGCTASAPCCCLPQNAVTNSCPMYGPFLPNDPCGSYTTGPIGDFPSNTGGVFPV